VDNELEKLKNVQTISLVQYIKSSMDIIIQMKLEARESKVNEKVAEKLRELDNNGKYDNTQNSEEYEKIIQKLEAEVRNHISVIHRALIHYRSNNR
jgi:uncharacterized protein with von Willebrand factor type A (vWA) domain